MTISRRKFLNELAASGALAGLLAKPDTAAAMAAAIDDTMQEPGAGNAAAFWGSFMAAPVHERGLMHKSQPGTDADRQVNFLHFDSTKGLRYADQIDPSELPDYPGDVAVSMTVGGIRLSTEDRAKFEQLQSAQLRIDMLQGQQMYGMIDPLAWMALAAIFPDEGGKLPPLQNLSFDPSSTANNMQKIVLPGGYGHVAVNVSMVHKASAFWTVINTLVTDASHIAPVLGLPAISVTALTGFSKLYGVLANRSTFLFQARPQPAYATQAAREKANSTIGMNLPEGDYVLVPQSHTDDLKPYLDKMKLANGYMVPKDASASDSTYESAEKAQPDISYITMHMAVRPLMQIGSHKTAGLRAAAATVAAAVAVQKRRARAAVVSPRRPRSPSKWRASHVRGSWKMKARGIAPVAALAVAVMTLPLQAQNFGMDKTKVTLKRKLPALVHLPGDTIRVQVEGHQDQADLSRDLSAMLETELLKDDARLRADENSAATTISCRIISFDHPAPTQTRQQFGNTVTVTVRVTGALNVTFQARTSAGRVLASDNVSAKYDQQFDAGGNNLSHGIVNDLKNPFHGFKGKSGNDDQGDKQPTEAELRSILLNDAVHQIAEHIVVTNESIDVFLAKNKGAVDEGDKEAVNGLWERALETYETAAPLTKKDDDAYRLYNIGVANEALGYAAEDPKSAMKFLDEAAINYGKAIDAKPSEKYFLEPQKRIETAIAHYRKLDEEKNAPLVEAVSAPPPAAAPAIASAPPENKPTPKPTRVSTPAAPKPAATHPGGGTTGGGSPALTDAKVIAMVKDGIDDDTVAAAVRNAKAVDFDLSSAAQRRLTAAGVSPAVLSAMKIRWSHELAK